MMFSLLLLGCPPSAEKQDILLEDANNYSFSAALDVAVTDIELAEDFTFDWSALTVDMLGHDVSTAEIDQIWLIWFRNLSNEELEQGLADNTVTQPDVDTVCTVNTKGKLTSAVGTDMGFSGNPCTPDQYWGLDQGTYMLRLTTGIDQDAETRMLHFVHPTKHSTNHQVDIGNSSSALDFTVDLNALTPVSAAAGVVPYLDWSGLTMDGLGAPIDWTTVTELWIARYDTLSVDDLASQFLDLELLYDELYTVSIYGLDGMELSQAASSDGTPFAGFTTDATWLLALRCPDCTSPAPPFFTTVSVQ